MPTKKQLDNLKNGRATRFEAARKLLASHSELLLNLFLHIGGGAGGQQKTDT